MNYSTLALSCHCIPRISMPKKVYYLVRLLPQDQAMYVGLDHGCFTARRPCVTSSLARCLVCSADGQPQAESRTSDNGEESTYHSTMAGRIFKIIAAKSHRAYVIVKAFNVSGSRDDRYGMPTMHANPQYGYQTIPPSVSYFFSLLGLNLITC
jgi:hypothetical protein